MVWVEPFNMAHPRFRKMHFSKFVEYEATEVHLATNFTNMFFDLIPADFRNKIYAYLDEKNAADRKPDMTDEQFYYKVARMPSDHSKPNPGDSADQREKIGQAWEEQFTKLFTSLGVRGTAKIVAEFIKPVMIKPDIKNYLAGGEKFPMSAIWPTNQFIKDVLPENPYNMSFQAVFYYEPS